MNAEYIEDIRIEVDPRLELKTALDAINEALKHQHVFPKKDLWRLDIIKGHLEVLNGQR